MGFLRTLTRSKKTGRSRKRVGIADEEAFARRFGWDEIVGLTQNFSTVIGSGGFGAVYLGRFDDSSFGAIKVQCNSERLRRIYRQELEILLLIRHHSIARLLGFCDEQGEGGVLVLEYASNGNLHEMLHESDGASGRKASVLPWKNRMTIAYQLAESLEYLHEKLPHQIIHGDIKPSNILLDDHLNCKLCDFGSAKMGFSAAVLPTSSSRMNRVMIGSPGYSDPHYLRTGIASKKNDVYSFGVVVLELITGLEAFCPATNERLASMAAPLSMGELRLEATVDPRLGGRFDTKEAMAMSSISAMCLVDSPNLRPSASDVLQMMRESVASISSLSL